MAKYIKLIAWLLLIAVLADFYAEINEFGCYVPFWERLNAADALP